MASARNEAPKAQMRWGPLPTGERSEDRKGYAPSPEIVFRFFKLKVASFCAFWELILLQFNCLSFIHA